MIFNGLFRFFLFLGLLFSSTAVWALPAPRPSPTHTAPPPVLSAPKAALPSRAAKATSKTTPAVVSKKATAKSVEGLCLEARSINAKQAMCEIVAPIQGGAWPTGAWVLEGVGVAVAIVGIVFFALSAGSQTTRDRKVSQASEEIKNTGVSKVSAKEVKALEDEAIAFNTTGWVVTAVGTAIFLVGVVWMFVHKPPQPKYVLQQRPEASPLVQYPPQQAQAPALLLQAGH